MGTAVPVTNNTDLRTNGWELTIGWNDRLSNGLQYGINFNLSDAYATITRYPNNPSHSLGNYIEGQRIGDIYGYETIGIAKSQEEMDAHIAKVDQSTIDNNKWVLVISCIVTSIMMVRFPRVPIRWKIMEILRR